VRPVKPQARGKYAGTSKFKIDGIVATICAVRRLMLKADEILEEGSSGPLAFYLQA
jgi:hypothetical protein